MKLYTDATIIDNRAIIGYVLQDNDKILDTNTKTIYESKISQAELKSIIYAIDTIIVNSIVEVYTDNHSIVDMYNGEGKPRDDQMQGLMWNLNRISEDIKINYVRSEDNIADTVVKSEPIN